MWHEGTIGIPMQDGGYKIAHYWVKSFDEGSEWGINGGRISKLMIKIDGRITANYDRGCDIDPDEGLPTQMAYCILLENYN
jgi:hypothetical protein